MKSKKAALVFNWTLTIMVIAILAWALIQFTSKYSRYETLGKRQLNLFQTYAKAESVLFYIDVSAEEFSLPQSVYDLAQNGGFSELEIGEDIDSSGFGKTEPDKKETKNCGRLYGYSVWYEVTKDESGYKENQCFDVKLAGTHLQKFFNRNLNKHLLKHPHNIPIDNYNYEIRGNLEIIGRAIQPLKFDILKEEEKEYAKEAVETPEGIVDFTGTELCKKGIRCMLTKEAHGLLIKAQETAKQKGVSLEATFGYRTLPEQEDAWRKNPDSMYVCPPSPSCPHLSGNAVDIRLKGKTFATMTPDEWRLLHRIMSEAGWVRYGDEKDPEIGEPWHFECCGTVRYARAKEQGVTAIV